jgi:hypothetical protein
LLLLGSCLTDAGAGVTEHAGGQPEVRRGHHGLLLGVHPGGEAITTGTGGLIGLHFQAVAMEGRR